MQKRISEESGEKELEKFLNELRRGINRWVNGNVK